MTTLSPRQLLPTFLPSVNALLAALSLPFFLDHPTDLTPSLLLAIFESLINARLPIPASVRQSRTRDAKARAMLVLLGVLECDVLRGGSSSSSSADPEHSVAISNADDSALAGAGGVSVDGWVDEIGLGEVDPERLADGGWEETIFVGELLCWLARRKGILPRTKPSHHSSHQRSLYSNHHSYGTEGGEGDTADFSTSLLLRPSPAQKSRRVPSPSPSIDAVTDADFSGLSHITDVPRHPLVHSPEPSLSVTDLSIRARSVSSRTSVSNVHDDPEEIEEASQDTIHVYDPRQMMQDAEEDDDRPPTFRPQCIHELEDPSYIRELAGPSTPFDPSVSHERAFEDLSGDEGEETDEQYNDDLYAPPTPTPRRVRLTGWIDAVDSTAELSHFATSRTRSRAPNTNTGSGLGQLQPHTRAYPGELPKSTTLLQRTASPPTLPGSSRSRTPRRISPSPSPPRRPPPRSSPSPPPSPPTHSDPPFDVSFSTLNNTSTPAKLRPPRRPQFQTTRNDITSSAHAGVDRRHGGSTATMGIATGPRPRRRDRTPSYTPSPPSFTTPGSLRSAGSSCRVGTSGSMTPTLPPPSTMISMAKKKNNNVRSISPSPMTSKSKSPPVSPPGSTATTNSLLTERARLLTELAAFKRALAASNSGKAVGQERAREVYRV